MRPRRLPAFAGSKLTGKPPLYFEGVSMITFPLRAKLLSLQRFCDAYLNIIPSELGFFRPAIPYVYLTMLDYGRMAIETANLGWSSQREILFCVPLEWYRRVDGHLEFCDWATISPFIFVDNPLSLDIGRSVYGWPKVLATLPPTFNDWITDPRQSVDASVSTQVFTHAYAGDRAQQRAFLQVRQEAHPILQFPPDMSGPLMPWAFFQNVANGMMGFARDFAYLLSGHGFGLSGDASALGNLSQMAMRGMALGTQPGGMGFNTLNLKQFRRSDRPDRYCYQALTSGPMRYQKFNHAALLGETAVWAGDVSGGYSIDLVDWPSLRIVETLGLEASATTDVEGSVAIAHLQPVLPFWTSVDMEYDRARNVAWRSDDGIWRDGDGRTVRSPRAGAEAESASLRFNTTLGPGTCVVTGPFKWRSTTSRVLPLLAVAATAQRYVDAILNEPLADTGERFEVWGAGEHTHVYLVISDGGNVSSDSNDIGDWAEMEVTFYVPVRHFRNGRLWSAGMVPAFSSARGTTQVCTRTELVGVPTMSAEFRIPAGDWVAEPESVSTTPRTLLSMDIQILPVLGEGEQTETRTVLQVLREPPSVDRPLSVSGDSFCRLLKQELKRKQDIQERHREQYRSAKLEPSDPSREQEQTSDPIRTGLILALDFLGNERALSIYTLKEFRDCEDPERACYQELSRILWRFTNLRELQEMEEPLRIELSAFASLRITETLGLVHKDVLAGEGASIHVLEPVRPFVLCYDATQANGDPLLYRAGGEPWSTPPAEAVEASWSFPLGLCRNSYDEAALGELVTTIDDGCSMLEVPYRVRDFCERLRKAEATSTLSAQSPPRDPTWSAKVGDFVRQCDPQTMLETLLSQEWGNHDDHARWRTARHDLTERLEEESLAWSGPRRVLKKLEILIARYEIRQAAEHQLLCNLARGFEETVKRVVKVEALFLELAEHITQKQDCDAASSKQWFERFANLAEDVRLKDLVQTVTGEPVEEEELLNETTGYRGVGNLYAGIKLYRTPGSGSREPLPDLAWLLHRIMKVVLPWIEQELERWVDIEARYAFKPAHCIPRGSAGADRDRVFPVADCWNDEWFTFGERFDRDIAILRKH